MNKSFFLVGIVVFLPCYAGQESATRGAITEALFIIQNKQKEVREYIQELKKGLTECLLVPVVSAQSLYMQLESYHCALKQIIFPCSIDEFECLVSRLSNSVDTLLQEKPVPVATVKEAVDTAFLVEDKIKAEVQVLALIFSIDDQQCLLKTGGKHLGRRRTTRAQDISSRVHTAKQVQRTLTRERHQLQKVKKGLLHINNKLYDKEGAEGRVYLENLVSCKV